VTSADARLLLVTIGTDPHRFDRLIAWVDGWLADHEEVPAMVQHSTSPPPSHGKAIDYLPYDALQELIGQASAVVCHCGTIISECLRLGVTPVVVPRRQHLLEAVDDHQVVFARRLARAGTVVCCESEADLHRELSSRLGDDAQPLRATPRPVAVTPPGIARASHELDRLMKGRSPDVH
jgi:UDP-N-acetylglucosamine transferase subunit ALG13